MRRFLALSALLAIAVAAACSTFGSNDDEPNNDNGNDAGQGGGDAPSINDGAPPEIDGAVSDGGGTTDGPADAGSCDLTSPQGTFLRASFDDGNCEAWFVTNGSIDFVPSPSRCGAGSCKVCSSGSDYFTLSRDLVVNQPAGSFELRYELRGDTFTGNAQAVLYIYDDAGIQLAVNQNSTVLNQGQWKSGQVIAPYPGTAGRVAVRVIGPQDAGGVCYYVDEVRLGHY